MTPSTKILSVQNMVCNKITFSPKRESTVKSSQSSMNFCILKNINVDTLCRCHALKIIDQNSISPIMQSFFIASFNSSPHKHSDQPHECDSVDSSSPCVCRLPCMPTNLQGSVHFYDQKLFYGVELERDLLT